MARTADERQKKRPRLSGSDSFAKDVKKLEETPASTKQDRSLRSCIKESPPDVTRRMRRGATNTTLSSQQQASAEKNGKKGAQSLPKRSGQHSSPHGSSGPKRKAKDPPDLEDLRLFVGVLGGALEDGWQVDAHRIYGGKLTKTYISPSKERFRSRIEVAKHLGLDVNSSKKGKTAKANTEMILVGRGEEAHGAKETSDLVTLQDMKSGLRRRSHAKDSGQRKEFGSKSPKSHEKAALSTNGGLVVASDASKAIVNIQKAPETSTVTQRCQDALRSIISTNNFAALSHALHGGGSAAVVESPLQLKALPLLAGSLDLQLIHLRLSTGVYGQTPELFSTDIQEVWQKIATAGYELVALAHTLSEFSDNLYKQQITSLFQEGGASKQISGRKGLLLPVSQHGKQSNGGVLLDNLQVLQETQLVTPPQSITAVQARVPEKSTPAQENSRNQAEEDGPQSLLKRSSAVPKSHQSKRQPKKVRKSKRPTVLKLKTTDNITPGACKSCGLQQGEDVVVCRLCNAVFHAHCLVSPPKSLPDNAWCCASCTTEENENDADKSRELLKATGKTGVCKVCKKEDSSVLLCDACEAAYHMKCVDPPIDSIPDDCWYCPTCAEDQKKSAGSFEDARENHSHPEDYNCAICNHMSKGSLPSNENTSTEHTDPENPSSRGGARSPDFSTPRGAPKNVLQLESPEASVENVPPEPGFLLEYENACKVCGVESTKPVILCAWCSKRFHLSCLRPPLKRPPRKTWFCPSCLCRVCEVDADDEKILLCDTCDEGYHTYCLDPPLSEKPEGAWFCPSCAKDVAPSSPKQTEVLKRKRKSTEPRRAT